MEEKDDTKQERINIQLAPHLLEWVDEQRKDAGITRSAFIALMLAEARQRRSEPIKG